MAKTVYDLYSEVNGIEAQIARLQSFDCDTSDLSAKVDRLMIEIRRMEKAEEET